MVYTTLSPTSTCTPSHRNTVAPPAFSKAAKHPRLALWLALLSGGNSKQLLKPLGDCLGGTSIELQQSGPRLGPPIGRQRKAIKNLGSHNADAGHDEAGPSFLVSIHPRPYRWPLLTIKCGVSRHSVLRDGRGMAGASVLATATSCRPGELSETGTSSMVNPSANRAPSFHDARAAAKCSNQTAPYRPQRTDIALTVSAETFSDRAAASYGSEGWGSSPSGRHMSSQVRDLAPRRLVPCRSRLAWFQAVVASAGCGCCALMLLLVAGAGRCPVMVVPLAGSGLDLELAAERGEPVGHVPQARAHRGVAGVVAGSVVGHGEPQGPVLRLQADPGLGGVGVFGGVLQRLQAAEVHRRLGVLRRTARSRRPRPPPAAATCWPGR